MARAAGAALAALATLSPALAGCTSGGSGTGTASGVPHASCSQVRCTGRLDGADFRIQVPDSWNGTLLLYSHGYRLEGLEDDVPAAGHGADVVPATGDAAKAGASTLLEAGYALAGSAGREHGWATQDAVRSATALYRYFSDHVGRPRRTVAWGASLGGLSSLLLAESTAWVSGVAAFCPPAAGGPDTFAASLDLATAVRTLLVPDLPLTALASRSDAARWWGRAADRVAQLAHGSPRQRARVLATALIAGLPLQSVHHDGSDDASVVTAAASSIRVALAAATLGRWEIEQRVGGNPTGNAGVDYAARLDAADRRRLDLVSAGASADVVRALQQAPRRTADPAAAARLAATGTPSGRLRVPTVTLHDGVDPFVPVQHEQALAQRAARSGGGEDLVRLRVDPPEHYDGSAPYGVGHCTFDAATELGALRLLQQWLDRGTRPDGPALERALRPAKHVEVAEPGSTPDWLRPLSTPVAVATSGDR